MHVDMFGKEIKVGDEIVYPGRAGSHLWMNHAVVVALTESKTVHWITKKPTPYLMVRRKTEMNHATGGRIASDSTTKTVCLAVLERVVIL